MELDAVREPEDAIMFLDVQGFSRAERTDEDRAAVRRTLQEIARDLLGDLGVAGEISDRGDGLLCVLPPELARRELLVRFFPNMELRLREHNKTHPRQREIRVRMVLSQGTSRVDPAPLTGRGIVSTAVNLASRLLDSEQLRDDLATAKERAVSLMVSHAYYTATLARENPLLAPAFRRVLVRAKDGVFEGWLYRPDFRHEPSRPVPLPTAGNRSLQDLPPHLFVSAFDVHVFDLYRRTVDPVPLGQQLATALLLSEGAIVHCADPYRRDEARGALERYRDFVENGEILFLLGNRIGDIRHDYRGYLENKAHDYVASGHGEVDVRSLEGPLREPDALGRAIDLIESSPWRLRRGYSGTHHFRQAMRQDIRHGEEIVSGARPIQKLRTVNLTLYQLLTLSYVSEGRVLRFIADLHMIEAFLEELDRLMQQQIISRQIILTALRDHFGAVLIEQDALLKLIEARIHSLYMSATTFPHAHIEVTPRRDEQSPYYYGHLRTHLQIVADDPGIGELSPALVRDLRDCPEWPAFVRHHLSCVSELAALRLADWSVDPRKIFTRHLHPGTFTVVAKVLRQHRPRHWSRDAEPRTW
jgi:hypothetical protein